MYLYWASGTILGCLLVDLQNYNCFCIAYTHVTADTCTLYSHYILKKAQDRVIPGSDSVHVFMVL